MNFAKQCSVFFLILGLAGCSGSGIKPDGDVDTQGVVARKVQSRWDALIKGDLATAYSYFSPGSRSVLTLEAYKAGLRPGRWKKVSVDSVACNQNRCDVVIMLEYSYRDIKSIVTRQEEVWLQDGGDWWYVPRK